VSAEKIAAEKEARMRLVHERNEKLRASAKIVRLLGEAEYQQEGEGIYTESPTAAMLRKKDEGKP
jgi:hypothetical protein